MFKVKPWMLGVGVVAVGGVGIAIYEAVQSKKPGGAPAVLAPAPTAGPPPLVTPVRPIASSAGGTFSQHPPPPGPQLHVTPGNMSATSLQGGQSVTLILPAGGSWNTVVAGNASTKAFTQQIGLNGDTTSPISLSTAQLVGANTIVADWKDAQGRAQQTVVSIPLVAKVAPLHF